MGYKYIHIRYIDGGCFSFKNYKNKVLNIKNLYKVPNVYENKIWRYTSKRLELKFKKSIYYINIILYL